MTSIGSMLLRDIAPEDLTSVARAIAPHVDELWVVEDLNWPGGIAQLASVLAATDDDASGRPVVGHGIAPAPFRNPAALAMEWATLARMYPGRLHCGIGHGVPKWMDQAGEAVASPLTLLRETIECTRAVLAGDRVNYVGRYVNVAGVELVFPPPIAPPVLAGVTGPKSLALAGMVADGTVLSEGFDADAVGKVRTQIAAGRGAPDAPATHRLTVFVGYYLGEIADLPPAPDDVPDGWAAVTDHAEHMIEILTPMMKSGLDSMVLIPFGPDPAQQLEQFQADVRPHLPM